MDNSPQNEKVHLFARFGRGDVGKDDNRFHLCQALRLVGKIGDLQLQRAVLLDSTALRKQPAQEYACLTFILIVLTVVKVFRKFSAGTVWYSGAHAYGYYTSS